MSGRTHQHCGSQIELVEKLRYKNVYLEYVRHVLTLDIAQDIDEPLEMFVGRTNPKEVHLQTEPLAGTQHNETQM